MTYENFISLPPIYEFRGLKLVQIAAEQATIDHVLRLALDGKLAGIHRFSDALLKLGTHYAIIEELDGHFVAAENLPFRHFTKLEDCDGARGGPANPRWIRSLP